MSLKKVSLLACLVIFLSSCFDRDRSLYEAMPQEVYFDFNLNQEVTLDINYGFNNENYVVLFDIYDQNPLVENADATLEKRTDIHPLFRAATDGNGKFSGETQIPSELSEVWLYSDYLGAISPIKLSIQNKGVSFDQKEYISSLQQKVAKSRAATTSNRHIYPDKWLTLGDWDSYGTPDYLMREVATPPSAILYSILDTYTTITDKVIPIRYPEFLDNNSKKINCDVKILKSTKVNLVFVHSSAGWNNTVGYFTYPTDQKPTSVDQIQHIIAFPNSSPIVKVTGGKTIRGALVCGNQVQLKYWNGTTFLDEFPAGVSIGWWIAGMGFKDNADLASSRMNYSSTQFNTDGQQHTVSLRDSETNQIVAIGFEDNNVMQYNDASFYLDVKEKDAIDIESPALPEVDPPTNKENLTKYTGTLAFEDLWPSMGDYDMNDVMITYKSTVFKTIIGNRVNRIVDEFIVYHNGASLQNGFGYQLHKLLPSDIRSVEIEGESFSEYMEGKTLEPGQTHPTILLTDNIGENIGKTIKVTIHLNDIANVSDVLPPYNPFIFSIPEQGQRKEIHLPKYPPTDKVDDSLFGHSADGSRPQDGLFYVGSQFWNQYPFAINLPILNFPAPQETIKIDAQYPKFREWVNSSGVVNKDWYKFLKK